MKHEPKQHDPRAATEYVTQTLLPPLPAADPELASALHDALAIQLAERDVASGAWDTPAVAAGERQLPSEDEIEAKADQEANEAQMRATFNDHFPTASWMEARAGARPLGEDQRRDRRGRELLTATTVAGALKEAGDIATALTDAETTHRATIDALAGRLDAEGRSRPAVVAAPESTNPTRVRRAILTRHWTITAVLMLLEAAAIFANLYELRYPTWEAAILVPVVLLVMTGAPAWLGHRIAALPTSGGSRGARSAELATTVGLLVAWVGAGVGLAYTRVDAHRRTLASEAAKEYAEAQQAWIDAGGTGAAPVLPETPAFDFATFAFWAVVLLGLGLVALMFEAHLHPLVIRELGERAQVLRLRAALVRCAEIEADNDAWKQKLEHAIATTRRVGELSVARVADRAEATKAVYRGEFIRQSGDPEMPGAMEARRSRLAMDRTARGPRAQLHPLDADDSEEEVA